MKSLLEKYFEVGEDGLTEEEIAHAIRKAVLSGRFYVVSGGDGRGVIVEKLLDAVVDFLPSPIDRGSALGVLILKLVMKLRAKLIERSAICCSCF